MNYLDDLNSMQKEAVEQTDGAVLMLAGAGSGKTRAITYRVAQLVRNGVRPWNILAITFTNKAAKEMRQRVNELVGDEAGDIFISTFHSACVRFLRRDIDKLGLGYTKSFTIYDTGDQKSVIKDCYRQLNIDDLTFKQGKVMSAISAQKDELISYQQYERYAKGDYYKETIAKIYTLYQTKLRKNNALDFDDIIFLTVKLFKDNPYVLESYQERFLYIMVDEYQDTNTAQYELVKTLAGKYKNLCVVGDDDQSIYGWRGANIQNIFDFEKDFTDTKIIKLEQNYRSTQNILNAANAVILNNLGRKDKRLWTENGEGGAINVYAADNEQEEAIFITGEIRKLNKDRLKDFAVLYRTNAQARALEEAFVKKNIPHRIFGSVRFYEHKEIKDILSYLKLLVNPYDDIAARRIINVPKRGAGKAAVDKILGYANEKDLSFFGAMQELYEAASPLLSQKLRAFVELMQELSAKIESPDVAELIEELLEKTGYMQMLDESGDEVEAMTRTDNVKELISKAAEFELGSSEIINLSSFLEEVALVADIDNYDDEEGSVTLMTIHSAKGLEFPVVFLSGLEDGLFPSYGSINSGPKGIEEERRLFYVGITRARDTLYLTRAKSRMSRGFREYTAPSRFMKEIPNELLEDIKTTAKKPKATPPPLKKNEYVSAINFSNAIKSIPQNVEIDFCEGDEVSHKKYGVGKVVQIIAAGKDYEVTVEFSDFGRKKFMAALSGLKKV